MSKIRSVRGRGFFLINKINDPLTNNFSYLYETNLFKVMRCNFLLAVLFFFGGLKSANAQSLKSDSLFVPSTVKQYQFHLDKPAVKIENLRYDQTDEPIRGRLNIDGTIIIMDNYKKGQRVKFDAIYADGTRVELKKSSCYIDPVRFDL